MYIDFQGINANNAEEFFQNIINRIIKTNYLLFKNACKEINDLRNSGIAFMQGFTEELVLLLKEVDKLVLILDEIDALSSYSFSDRVFSQIRSHYFDRVTYPELNKLTYLLSGVVEPKNIIKDPNISPFNIGQKIYVNDFTIDEFFSFIDKIGFRNKYNESIINRIYYWTKGHPRMTWDLCQTIDERLNVESLEDVDSVVKDLYLTRYDIAPIDSIRDMVVENQKLRDAVVSLTVNRGNQIDEDVKSELYLAGITNYDNNVLKIKNPILEKSLPYEWLISFDRNDLDMVNRAETDIYVNFNYGSAITKLQSIIKNLQDEKLKSRAIYLLGLAYFRNSQTQKSLDSLLEIKESDTEYFDAQLVIGHNYFNLGDYDIALDVYRKALRKTNNGHYTIRYKLGIADIAINAKTSQSVYDEAKSLLYQIANNAKSYPDDLHAIIAVYYYLSEMELRDGKIEEACDFLNTALIIASGDEKPYLWYKLILASPNDEEKKKIKDALKAYLIALQEKPQAEDFNNPMALNYLWFIEILSYFIAYGNDDVNDLDKCLNLIFTSKEAAYEKIMTLVSQLDVERASLVAKKIIELSKLDNWHFSKSQIISAHIIGFKEKSEYENKYQITKIADLIIEAGNDRPQNEAIRRYVFSAARLELNSSQLKRAEYYIDSYERIFEPAKSLEIRCFDVVLVAFKAILLSRLNRMSEFYATSTSFMNLCDDYIGRVGDTKIEVSVNEINQLKTMLMKIGKRVAPVRIQVEMLGRDYDKIDRNQRITVFNKLTNTTETGKFKKFERMIESGFYEIVGFK